MLLLKNAGVLPEQTAAFDTVHAAAADRVCFNIKVL